MARRPKPGAVVLRGLRDGGHGVELVSTSNSPLAVRAAEQEIPVYAVAHAARRLAAARLIRRLLRERHFDIVHVNEAHALTAAWVARAHRRAPLVIARRVTFPVSRGRVALARYRAAACIVAVSRAVREQLLAAGLDPARIVVVPDGVEIPPTVSAEARQGARERWNIAPAERVLALVASFTAEKGHALLLEAFAELHRGATEGRWPRCRLLLAGDGPLRGALERQAAAAGHCECGDIRGLCCGGRRGLWGVRLVRIPVAARRRRDVLAGRHGAGAAGDRYSDGRHCGDCGR